MERKKRTARGVGLYRGLLTSHAVTVNLTPSHWRRHPRTHTHTHTHTRTSAAAAAAAVATDVSGSRTAAKRCVDDVDVQLPSVYPNDCRTDRLTMTACQKKNIHHDAIWLRCALKRAERDVTEVNRTELTWFSFLTN